MDDYKESKSDVIQSSIVTAAMLEICYVAAVCKLLSVKLYAGIHGYTSRIMATIIIILLSDFCILTYVLFTLSIHPTWRRGHIIQFNNVTAPHV